MNVCVAVVVVTIVVAVAVAVAAAVVVAAVVVTAVAVVTIVVVDGDFFPGVDSLLPSFHSRFSDDKVECKIFRVVIIC